LRALRPDGASYPAAVLDAARVARVQAALLEWYAREGRDLPWRRTRDPYAVLVAEVMLQQTQVERVIPKWHAWLARFPSFAELAAASRADAVRAWQGLGYNLRAVRLHTIAQQMVEEYGGRLPGRVEELLQLKGIGRYTAGAVACFAFEQPVAMVDTNVRRVVSRVFRAEAPDALAEALVPGHAAYAWNQALMDLGATVCTARRPMCLVCPLRGECSAAGAARQVRETRATYVLAREREAAQGRARRGRVVDVLRRLPTGGWIELTELGARLDPPEPRARLARVVERLVADGLLVRRATQVRLAD
jgi:A/G-specific adenine glycosylase